MHPCPIHRCDYSSEDAATVDEHIRTHCEYLTYQPGKREESSVNSETVSTPTSPSINDYITCNVSTKEKKNKLQWKTKQEWTFSIQYKREFFSPTLYDMIRKATYGRHVKRECDGMMLRLTVKRWNPTLGKFTTRATRNTGRSAPHVPARVETESIAGKGLQGAADSGEPAMFYKN